MKQMIVVAGLIENDKGEFLVGNRPDGTGYCNPGGKVEYGEKLERALAREIEEETSIRVSHPLMRFVGYTQPTGMLVMFYYIPHTIWFGSPKNMEPRKCLGWEWVGPNAWPAKMVEGLRLLLCDTPLLLALQRLRREYISTSVQSLQERA